MNLLACLSIWNSELIGLFVYMELWTEWSVCLYETLYLLVCLSIWNSVLTGLFVYMKLCLCTYEEPWMAPAQVVTLKNGVGPGRLYKLDPPLQTLQPYRYLPPFSLYPPCRAHIFGHEPEGNNKENQEDPEDGVMLQVFSRRAIFGRFFRFSPGFQAFPSGLLLI